jgi:hypothetical protein
MLDAVANSSKGHSADDTVDLRCDGETYLIFICARAVGVLPLLLRAQKFW